MNLRRLSWTLRPDPGRVILRPFEPGDSERVERMVERGRALPPSLLQEVQAQFEGRHRDLEGYLASRSPVQDLPWEQRVLVGSLFTCEYAYQAAALFNPSLVPHPDQSGMADGSLRVVMSLRAVGEGHVSSLEFRSGVVSADGDLVLDPPGRWATPGVPVPAADGGYTVEFLPEMPLDERVVFPFLASECKGIEDVRFVAFEEGLFYGTYTAYDGFAIQPRLMETPDFRRFRIRPLGGAAARNKGMALFPCKIRDRFVMIGRQDGESLFLMESDRLDTWEERRPLYAPKLAWEAMQMGNCGSPLQTSEGWLLITHGVGPVRRYCLGAVLLDLEDPQIVRAVLQEPLLAPQEDEREGYVPNVVYSCGGLIHEGNLVLPYGASDVITRTAVVPVRDVLAAMTPL